MEKVYRKFECCLLCYFLIHYCKHVLDEAKMKRFRYNVSIDIIDASEKNVSAIQVATTRIEYGENRRSAGHEEDRDNYSNKYCY